MFLVFNLTYCVHRKYMHDFIEKSMGIEIFESMKRERRYIESLFKCHLPSYLLNSRNHYDIHTFLFYLPLHYFEIRSTERMCAGEIANYCVQFHFLFFGFFLYYIHAWTYAPRHKSNLLPTE